ncbi:MAG: hypothetical protein ACR2J1_07395, partial [Methyloceanibacter sp.]
SAPVPFGGALIYVPAEWVKPAEGGVERLMNVYVSMGVTPPLGRPSDARRALATVSAVGAITPPRKPKTPRAPKKPTAET